MKKKVLLIGGGSVLLLLSILFGAFFAGPLFASAHGTSSQPSATPTTNPYCQQYLQELAQSLHVSVATLEQDKKTAKGDVLAQLLKDGKLNQAQADAISKRINAHQACSGKGKAWWDHGILRQTLKKYQTTLVSDIASGLHLSASQFQSDLQNGQTLAQVAKMQNISDSQLHTIVLNAVDNVLSQAQKAGDLTQSQVTTFTTYLRKHPRVINRWLHHTFAKK